jgi:hypothetical protein
MSELGDFPEPFPSLWLPCYVSQSNDAGEPAVYPNQILGLHE